VIARSSGEAVAQSDRDGCDALRGVLPAEDYHRSIMSITVGSRTARWSSREVAKFASRMWNRLKA